MSDFERTLPSRVIGVPLCELCVEIVTGADAGKRAVSLDEPISVGVAQGNTLVLSDRLVSRYHLELDRRGDRIAIADLGSTNGSHVGTLCFEGGTVAVQTGTIVRIGDTEIRVGDGNVKLESAGARASFAGLGSDSPAMRRVLARAERLANTEVAVLWLGESGTGKELLARALHEHGPASAHPFVTLDCAAIPPSLFQSTLFGHERGAFTGADRAHVGALERAARGTLFLDEIGELSLAEQAVLLGVLERRRFLRVGGHKELEFSARVVAATNRDLRAEVNRGTFRLDLYYRLAVATLRVPSLRERMEDLPALVRRFLVEAGCDGEPHELLGPDVLEGFYRHTWPGNVRELRNAVNATLALGEPPELLAVAHAPQSGDVIEASLGLDYRVAKATVTNEFEVRYLKELLARAGGNVRQAARLARMNRAYLIELLRRHELG